MGLFDALPAPKRPVEGEPEAAAQRDKSARLEEPEGAALVPAGCSPQAAAAAAAAAEPSVADLDDLEEEDGQQQPAADDLGEQAGQQGDGDVPPPPPPPPPPADAAGGPNDQVAAALRKIAGHISHPKKFAKASQLLRELLAQGAVQPAHGPLLFSALKAAMRDTSQAADPMLSREYSKLFTAASKVSDVFTLREKNQLDVYGTWAVLRTSLATTDDSFAFNKVVGQLKAMVEELPEATEEDEEHQRQLQAAAGAADPVLEAYDARLAEASGAAQQPAPAAAAAAGPSADVEADPFGLDALLEQQAAAEAAAAAKKRQAPKSSTWSSGEVVCQRRAALLDCLDMAKASYRHLWARTSVDLLVEHYHQHKRKFTASQRARIDDLMGFVRDQRRLRKLGPSAKEVNRDTTSFERARAEWSRTDVSHRGKVGSAGDHRAENWLG